MKTESKPAEETETTEVEKVEAPTEGEDAGKENAIPEYVEDKPEPEPETVTYDEYLESLKEKRPEGDEKETREVANDDFEGKVAQAFVKKDDDNEGPQYDLGTANKKKNKGKKKVKKLMNIDEFMKDAPGGGNRGYGRRGGRGGRRQGRGGGRLNMDDFPVLG